MVDDDVEIDDELRGSEGHISNLKRGFTKKEGGKGFQKNAFG